MSRADYSHKARERTGLICPKCGKRRFRVLKTRRGNGSVRRRRVCQECDQRLWSEEKIVHVG